MKAIYLTTFLCVASLFAVAQQAVKPSVQSAPAQSDAATPEHLPPGAHIENEWGIPVEVLPDGSRKPLWKGNADKVKSAPVISADSPQAMVHPARIKKPAASAKQNPIVKESHQKKSGADTSGTQPATTDGTGDASATPATP